MGVSSYQELLDKVRGAPAGRKRKKKAVAGVVEAQVRATLLHLMSASGSDSVRVAAAKALMDKLLQTDQEGDDARQHENEERAAAIDEARALLAELAEIKSGGVCEPRAVVEDGPLQPADSGGGVAGLVDSGGARVGEDADGG